MTKQPAEAFHINPAYASRGEECADNYINTAVVIDHPEYYDAIRVYIDGIEAGEPIHLDAVNAQRLIDMLTAHLAILNSVLATKTTAA